MDAGRKGFSRDGERARENGEGKDRHVSEKCETVTVNVNTENKHPAMSGQSSLITKEQGTVCWF